MSEKVSVDPADLHHAGHQFAGWRSDAHNVFTAAHDEIEGAVGAGWVGASANAMTARLATMRAAAETVTARPGDHSTDMRSSAVRYTATEIESADRIDSAGTGSNPGDVPLRL